MLRELQINEAFADNVRDWVDADDRVNGFGAEDTTYLGKFPLIERQIRLFPGLNFSF